MKSVISAAALAVAVALLLLAVPASARVIDDGHGHPLSCPDPTVSDAGSRADRYVLLCTSDRASDAFPIRVSSDLVHWRAAGTVFPHGHQPWWALPSPAGAYWAPAVYRFGGRWIVYFAAQTNGVRVHLRPESGMPMRAGTMAVGVATAPSLRGPWRTRLLHWRGEFNGEQNELENYGGVIDPSVVTDPRTGRRYLFWAEQPASIWVTKLSRDGLTIGSRVHQALRVRPGWECLGGCTVEGPEEFYRGGLFYLLYSGASTWTGSYAVGVAVSSDPLHGQFRRVLRQPALASSRRWIGPGGTSHPVRGPDGRDWLLYHASRRPNPSHLSESRYLLESPLRWPPYALGPRIGDGHAG